MSERYDNARRRRTTLEDVATKVGLAKTTISDILNARQDGRYAEATRKRVFRAVSQLGYQPHRAAQELVRGRSGQIGLYLARDFSNPFFARLAHQVQVALRRHGYRMQLAIDDGVAGSEATLIRELKSDGVEGVIVGPIYEALDLDLHREIFRGQVPLVTFGDAVDSEFDEVVIQSLDAWRLAIEHLRAMGHQRIGFLMAPTPRVADQRSVSMQPALVREGYDARFIVSGDDVGDYARLHEISRDFIRQWKNTADRATAMMCLNDQVAVTLLNAAIEQQVDVPNDLSVMGRDNLPESRFFNPALTTIDNRIDATVEAAVRLLQRRIKEPSIPRQVETIAPQLIERASVARI